MSVYFVVEREPAYQYVKIGMSYSSKQRQKSLQTGNPRELCVLAVMLGEEDIEKELHKQFSQYHVRGEWFTLNADILYFVESCRDVQIKDLDLWLEVTSIYSAQESNLFKAAKKVKEDRLQEEKEKIYNKLKLEFDVGTTLQEQEKTINIIMSYCTDDDLFTDEIAAWQRQKEELLDAAQNLKKIIDLNPFSFVQDVQQLKDRMIQCENANVPLMNEKLEINRVSLLTFLNAVEKLNSTYIGIEEMGCKHYDIPLEIRGRRRFKKCFTGIRGVCWISNILTGKNSV